MINGQEVSEMVHDDVVNLIRAARDLEHEGKLVLTVQQKGKWVLLLKLFTHIYYFCIIYVIFLICNIAKTIDSFNVRSTKLFNILINIPTL